MSTFKCPGPVQDDTGVRYCPFQPENDEPDCDHCMREYEADQERSWDASVEEKELLW